MTTPTVYGGIGINGNGLGTIGLGGAQPSRSLAFSTLRPTTLPYIAHLYDHNLKFKKTLGPLLNKPSLKMTVNAGYQPIMIEVPSPLSGPVPGAPGMPIYGNTIYGQQT